MEQSHKAGGIPVAFLLKSLLFSYILTGVFLALLSFLLYKLGLGEKVVAIAIIGIYVAATFLAGFLAGKKVQNRKFMWGLLEGAAYFLILAVISAIAGKEGITFGKSFFTTLALCIGGGMLGGMLS
ncbi:MAG: TIGR04086 family membrane protein [Butyrivibrio sp.]|nr:TIGR04086 family membrane protein [Acetatifactor muris]MCM1558454.1 TIGR04086 family membrane protein [Butyrivibrio sp.]